MSTANVANANTLRSQAEVEMGRSSYILVIWFSLVAASGCMALTIVPRSTAEFQIVLPDADDNAPVDSFLVKSAELLQRCVEESTGVALPIRRESEILPARPGIFLGATRATLAHGLSLHSLHGWEYRIVVADGNLFLAGLDRPGPRQVKNFAFYQLGTAKAVTEFLKKFLGVSFLLPGKDGLCIPSRDGLTVPDDLAIHGQPGIPFCTSRQAEIFYDLANNFLPAVSYGTYGGHSHDKAVPPEIYGESHPEYFALRDGKRFINPDRPLYCLSNPEVQELIYQNLLQHADQGYEVVQLGQSDGFIGCQCAECQQLFGIVRADATREADTTAWRERLWILHRKMAERFLQDRPSKKLAIMAYGPTRQPPSSFRDFPANTIIELTKSEEDDLAAWNQLKVPGGYYVYLYNWGRYQPLSYAPKRPPQFIAEQVRRFHQNRVKGIYRCGFGELFGLEGPVYYLFGQLLGDPDLDPQAVIAAYCQAAYGEAGKPMLHFFDLLHERLRIDDETLDQDWNAPEWVDGLLAPEEQTSRILRARFPRDVLTMLDAHLHEAGLALKADSLEAKRYHLVRVEFDYLRQLVEVMHRFSEYRQAPSLENLSALRSQVEDRLTFIDSLSADGTPRAARPSFRPFGGASGEKLIYGDRNQFHIPFKWDFAYYEKAAVNPGARVVTVTPGEEAAGSQPLLNAFLDEAEPIVRSDPTTVRCSLVDDLLTVIFSCEHTRQISDDMFAVTLAPDRQGKQQLRFSFQGIAGLAVVSRLVAPSALNDWKGDLYWGYHPNAEATVAVSSGDQQTASEVKLTIPLRNFFDASSPPAGIWYANFVRRRSDPAATYVWQPELVYPSRSQPPDDALGVLQVGGEAQAEPVVGENLLINGDFEQTGGWDGYRYLNGEVAPDIREKILATMSWGIADEPIAPGNHVMMLENGPGSQRFIDQKGWPIISSRVVQSVAPKSAPLSRYRVTFRVRSDEPDDERIRHDLTLQIDLGGEPEERLTRRIPVTRDWVTFSQLVVLPAAGSESMKLSWILYRRGKLLLDDMQLVPLREHHH